MKEIGKIISGMVKLSMLMEIAMHEWANDKEGYGKLSIIINGIEYLGSFKDDFITVKGLIKLR